MLCLHANFVNMTSQGTQIKETIMTVTQTVSDELKPVNLTPFFVLLFMYY